MTCRQIHLVEWNWADRGRGFVVTEIKLTFLLKRWAVLIELLKKTNYFNQLLIAFGENSDNILFFLKLEDNRYIHKGDCVSPPITTTQTAPTTIHPTTPSVIPTTVDPDDDFVCPHGGNDLFPRPGHCNQFYMCKDGYPAKMYIFVSGHHPPDFIDFVSRYAAQNHWFKFFYIIELSSRLSIWRIDQAMRRRWSHPVLINQFTADIHRST